MKLSDVLWRNVARSLLEAAALVAVLWLLLRAVLA